MYHVQDMRTLQMQRREEIYEEYSQYVSLLMGFAVQETRKTLRALLADSAASRARRMLQTGMEPERLVQAWCAEIADKLACGFVRTMLKEETRAAAVEKMMVDVRHALSLEPEFVHVRRTGSITRRRSCWSAARKAKRRSIPASRTSPTTSGSSWRSLSTTPASITSKRCARPSSCRSRRR